MRRLSQTQDFSSDNCRPSIRESSSTPSYRLDFVVEDMVVVEVKSVATFLPVHEAQLLTYLRLSEQPAGLLINFNVPKLIDGVTRVINPKVANR
jgi:GxxExxY protein